MGSRIRPAQLGCGRPYFTGYSTRILAKDAGGEAIICQFIDRYNSACVKLHWIFRELFVDAENHLTLYALLLPGRPPETIRESRFWRENVSPTQEAFTDSARATRVWSDPARPKTRPITWPELNLQSTYALLTVLANPGIEDPSTRPARIWKQMIAEYDLKCRGLDPAKLEDLFEDIPDLETRKRIGESVGSVFRSHLSRIERAKETALERRRLVSELEGQHPALFNELSAYAEDSRSWRRACRYFSDLRKLKASDLKKQGIETAKRVLWAVQRAAMRRVVNRMPSWSGIQPPTSEDDALVAQYPAMVDEFVAAVISDEEVDPFEEDDFRRFASRNALPVRLADEPNQLATIIDLYHRHVSPLSDDLMSLLAQRTQFGRRTVHSGWQTVCRELAKKGKRDSTAGGSEAHKLHQFISRNIRTWFNNLRPIRAPQWPEKLVFWPCLREGTDWQHLANARPQWGNSIEVSLRIPTPEGRALVAANLRGNLAVAKAQRIEPLNVANGLSQFWPDQQLTKIADNRPQRTYVKLQSMRLMREDNRLLAYICATQMTELLHSPEVTKDFATSIRDGERLLLIHLYPGGRILAQMVMFERRLNFPGWKQLSIEEIIRDTREESFTEVNGRRVHVKTQRKHRSGFIVLDDTSHLLRRADLEIFSRDPDPQRNLELMRQMGEPKRNLGEIHYQQLAARIAALCRFNRIGYTLIAGTGRLIGRMPTKDGGKPSLIVAPTQQFVSVRQVGNRRQLQGFLISALEKSGVSVLFTSARAKNVWVKQFLQQQSLEGCVGAHPYHEDPTQEAGRAYTGKKTLIAPDEKTPGYAYPLSATWSILLDWSNPAFREHVDRVIAVTR